MIMPSPGTSTASSNLLPDRFPFTSCVTPRSAAARPGRTPNLAPRGSVTRGPPQAESFWNRRLASHPAAGRPTSPPPPVSLRGAKRRGVWSSPRRDQRSPPQRVAQILQNQSNPRHKNDLTHATQNTPSWLDVSQRGTTMNCVPSHSHRRRWRRDDRLILHPSFHNTWLSFGGAPRLLAHSFARLKSRRCRERTTAA